MKKRTRYKKEHRQTIKGLEEAESYLVIACKDSFAQCTLLGEGSDEETYNDIVKTLVSFLSFKTNFKENEMGYHIQRALRCAVQIHLIETASDSPSNIDPSQVN